MDLHERLRDDLQATAVLDAWVEVHEQTGPQIRGNEPSL